MDETSRIVETILNDLVELVEKSEANDVLAASARRAASGKNYSDPILAELDDYFLNQCLSPSTDEDQDSEDQVVATNDDNESPFGRWRAWNWNNVRCDACRCKESLYWRRVARQLMVCNSCFFKKTYLILFNDEKFKKSGGVCTDQSSVEETSRTNKDTTSSSSTSSSKRKKSKQNSGQMSKKLASGDSSSRPLTRTALNGSAKNTNRSSPLPQPTNGGGSNGFTSQLSSSSASVKSEPQTASSTITNSSTNAGEDGSGSNDSKDLCSNENKPVQCLNVRKSARISQSRSKSRLKETNGDENSNNETQDIEMNGSSETSSTSTSKQQQQSTSNQQQTTTNETNRRTKLFKNRKPNALRVKIEKPEPPLVYKIDPHEYAFHQGFLIKIGDIVALRRKKDSPNEDDECIYFAQIRAFLCDQYGEKSAVITWLIPVANGADYSPTRIRVPKDFEPSLFTLGPAEESPRPLHTLEFVYRPESVSTSLSNDYDYLNQYKSDLLRHKFELEDLSASNFRIIKSADSSNGLVVKHEFISNSL